ncbi:MAG: LexA family transcriptional regulator [Candidatus Gastranaerophilales bacterium]|nr:LexA family transcriptional regulator [Candidatus Gastranaerophilales bacterium]
METIGQRLKYFRKELRLTAEEMADSLGLKLRTYGGYERDEREPSVDTYKNLSTIHNLNITWLITGKENTYSNRVSRLGDCIPIKIRGNIKASMGSGLIISDENPTGVYYISNQLVKDLNLNQNTTEMIFAEGNSMEGTIQAGSAIIIDLSNREIHDGKIYCVRIDGQLYAKRLQKIPPNKIKIISDNKDYDPFYVDLSQDINFDFEVIGKVKWWATVAK